MNRSNLRQYLLASEEQSGRQDYRIRCPYCVSSKTGAADRSLSVNKTLGLYYCFRCQVSGRYKATSAPAAELVDVCEMSPPAGFMPATNPDFWRIPLLAQARAYAIKRNLRGTEAQTQYGACIGGKFDSRLVIPIILDGAWVGYVGRAWLPEMRPYMYPAGMNRKELLYNGSAVEVETTTPLLIVEGVLDAIQFLPNAVALLGKPSKAQVEKLRRARRPVVVCLDGDAWREGEALALQLSIHGLASSSYKLPPLTDPDEYTLEINRDVFNKKEEEDSNADSSEQARVHR